MSRIDCLPTNQRRAIRALMTKPTVELAAKFAQVGESSLQRWLSQADFRAALLEAEGKALDHTAMRLVALSESAVLVITQILASPITPPAIRLRAAQVVLESMLRLVELRNLERRIAELEGARNA